MEVILLETIDGLGRRGSVVNVKNGFGRNYLLPNKKALPVTADNLFRLKSLKTRFEEEETRLLKDLSVVAAKVDGQSVVIKTRTTPEGHLFGSVSPKSLRAVLLEKGLDVPEKAIRLAEPIKTVGTYSVPVRLHPEITAHLSVIVESENVAPALETPAPEAPGPPAESKAS